MLSEKRGVRRSQEGRWFTLNETVVWTLTLRVRQMATVSSEVRVSQQRRERGGKGLTLLDGRERVDVIRLPTVASLERLRVGGGVSGNERHVVVESLEHINAYIVPASEEVAMGINPQDVGLVLIVTLSDRTGDSWSFGFGEVCTRDTNVVKSEKRDRESKRSTQTSKRYLEQTGWLGQESPVYFNPPMGSLSGSRSPPSF
jgi:hypothetical protein